MVFVYPAIIHNETNSYWVEFPDLEGCQTYGSTLAETMTLASESLGLYLSTLIENNIEIKSPSDITSITVKETNAFVSLVTCDVSKYLTDVKSVKKTLTIPAWLNNIAMKENINFSKILQDALINKIQARQ